MLYNTTFKHSKLNICGVNHCCIINGISKNDAVNLLQNSDLAEERGVF